MGLREKRYGDTNSCVVSFETALFFSDTLHAEPIEDDEYEAKEARQA